MGIVEGWQAMEGGGRQQKPVQASPEPVPVTIGASSPHDHSRAGVRGRWKLGLMRGGPPSGVPRREPIGRFLVKSASASWMLPSLSRYV